MNFNDKDFDPKKGNFDPRKNTATLKQTVDDNERLLDWALRTAGVGDIVLEYDTDDGPATVEIAVDRLNNPNVFRDLTLYWRWRAASVYRLLGAETSTSLAVYLAVNDHEDVFYDERYDLARYEEGRQIFETLTSHPDTLKPVYIDTLRRSDLN